MTGCLLSSSQNQQSFLLLHLISSVVSLCQRRNCKFDKSPTFVLQNSVVTETKMCSTKVGELSHWQFVLWQSENTAWFHFAKWQFFGLTQQLCLLKKIYYTPRLSLFFMLFLSCYFIRSSGQFMLELKVWKQRSGRWY